MRGSDPGEIEKLAEQPAEPVALPYDQAGEKALVFVGVLGASKLLNRAPDRRERIPNLVRRDLPTLAGAPPFTGPTHQSIIAKSLSAPRPQVTRVRSEVPPELEQVVLRAMSVDAAQRYSDMNAFNAALRQARSAPDRRGRRRFYFRSAAALLVAEAGGGRGLGPPAPPHNG